MSKMALNGYQKLAIATVLATLFLIFVGGLVRAAGAGLGCPDWPRCFGLWIPPTSAEALPAGFDPAEFNVVHTWLEYVNRLTGVIIGFLITLTFLFSLRYWSRDRTITVSAAVAFLLVLLQGWLGGQVVRSGLSEGMITLHMLLAMVIVTILVFTAFRAAGNQWRFVLPPNRRSRLLWITGVLFILTIVQMISGTQVREIVDGLKNAPEPMPRELWIEQLEGWLYFAHRSFSWLLLAGAGWLWWDNRRHQIGRPLSWLAVTIFLMVLLQMFAGVGMEWFHIPGVLQLVHLVGSALLLCALLLYFLMVRYAGPGQS